MKLLITFREHNVCGCRYLRFASIARSMANIFGMTVIINIKVIESWCMISVNGSNVTECVSCGVYPSKSSNKKRQ